MRLAFRWFFPGLALLGLLAILGLSGCGGGTSPLNLAEPVENGTIGSISGTIFTLVMDSGSGHGVIDLPANVQVTITSEDLSYTQTTTSGVTGSYQFADVPKGTYTVSAEAVSDALTISGEVEHVIVKGGIPTLNVDLILGNPAKMVTFTGTVTQNSLPSAGAVVTVEVGASPFPYIPYDPADFRTKRAAYAKTFTENDGSYSITVPDDGAINYYVYAYTSTSDFTESPELIPDPISHQLSPAQLSNNFDLQTAGNTTATTPTLYLMSITLPAPTIAGSLQAAATRLAVAQLSGAPQSHIDMLQKMHQTRQAMVRAASPVSIVENDLNWEDLQQSWDVQGYYIYRADSLSGAYTKLGSTSNPYQNVFVDNDPLLPLDTPTYYTVTSFAANNVISKPAAPVMAKPLPAINNVRSEDSLGNPATTASGQITLKWDPVPGAKSYYVVVYTTQPTFNSPVDATSKRLSGNYNTSTTIVLPVGAVSPIDYWWTVAAFSNDVALAWGSSSAAYSAYHQFTLNP